MQFESILASLCTLEDPAMFPENSWTTDDHRHRNSSLNKTELKSIETENVMPEFSTASQEVIGLDKTIGNSIQRLLCMFLKDTKNKNVPIAADNFVLFVKNWIAQNSKAERLALNNNQLEETQVNENDGHHDKAIEVLSEMEKFNFKIKPRNQRCHNNIDEQHINDNHANNEKLEQKKTTSMHYLSMTSRQLRKLALKNIMAQRKPTTTEKRKKRKKVVNESKVWKCRPVIRKVTCVPLNGVWIYSIEKSTRRCDERLSLQDLLKMKVEARLKFEAVVV